MGVVAVCLVVLMTRMELEHVSDTKELENPKTALRMSFFANSSYCGRYAFK